MFHDQNHQCFFWRTWILIRTKSYRRLYTQYKWDLRLDHFAQWSVSTYSKCNMQSRKLYFGLNQQLLIYIKYIDTFDKENFFKIAAFRKGIYCVILLLKWAINPFLFMCKKKGGGGTLVFKDFFIIMFS